jgi:hypothetical protein
MNPTSHITFKFFKTMIILGILSMQLSNERMIFNIYMFSKTNMEINGVLTFHRSLLPLDKIYCEEKLHIRPPTDAQVPS